MRQDRAHKREQEPEWCVVYAEHEGPAGMNRCYANHTATQNKDISRHWSTKMKIRTRRRHTQQHTSVDAEVRQGTAARAKEPAVFILLGRRPGEECHRPAALPESLW